MNQMLNICVDVFEDVGGCEEFEIPLREAVDALAGALADIPEEFRDSARFRVYGNGDYVSVSSEVRFRRPETDEEMEARDHQSAAYRKRGEDLERATYERLRQKFGAPDKERS